MAIVNLDTRILSALVFRPGSDYTAHHHYIPDTHYQNIGRDCYPELALHYVELYL